MTERIFDCRCSHELPERDILAAAALPFLINASLVDNASKADVKRVNFQNCCFLGIALIKSVFPGVVGAPRGSLIAA